MTKSKKTAKQLNSCLCTCGKKVKGTFAQGHDARLRGMLLRGEIKGRLSDAMKAFVKSHKIEVGAYAKAAAATA